MNRTIDAEASEIQHCRRQKGNEFRRRHLARRHGKLAMMRFAESACVTVDFDIVGWIPKDHIRWLAAQKHLIALWLPSVPAKKAVLAQQPHVAVTSYRPGITFRLDDFIGFIRSCFAASVAQQNVELWGIKAS